MVGKSPTKANSPAKKASPAKNTSPAKKQTPTKTPPSKNVSPAKKPSPSPTKSPLSKKPSPTKNASPAKKPSPKKSPSNSKTSPSSKKATPAKTAKPAPAKPATKRPLPQPSGKPVEELYQIMSQTSDQLKLFEFNLRVALEKLGCVRQPNPYLRGSTTLCEILKPEEDDDRVSLYQEFGESLKLIGNTISIAPGLNGQVFTKYGIAQKLCGQVENELMSTAQKVYSRPMKNFLEKDITGVLESKHNLDALKKDHDILVSLEDDPRKPTHEMVSKRMELGDSIKAYKKDLNGIIKSPLHYKCLVRLMGSQIKHHEECVRILEQLNM